MSEEFLTAASDAAAGREWIMEEAEGDAATPGEPFAANGTATPAQPDS